MSSTAATAPMGFVPEDWRLLFDAAKARLVQLADGLPAQTDPARLHLLDCVEALSQLQDHALQELARLDMKEPAGAARQRTL